MDSHGQRFVCLYVYTCTYIEIAASLSGAARARCVPVHPSLRLQAIHRPDRVKMWQFSNIYVIASIAVVGGSLFGFDISSMSAQLSTNSYKCYYNQGPHPLNATDPNCSGPRSLVQGGITAAMPAGSWLGALISGILSDRIGRKPSIIIGCWIWSVLLMPRCLFSPRQ